MTRTPITLVDRYRAVATSTWSDALDKLGIAGVMHGLRMRSGSGRVAGPAVTVKESIGDYPLEAFAVGEFLDAIGAGTILTIELGGAAVSTFGGLAAQAAVNAKAAAVVIDGGCRDVADIELTRLWVASRHVTPKSGKGRIKVEGINVAITMCGVTVQPGDMIVGDETGVVCIPADRLEEAVIVAAELTQNDERFADALSEGEKFREVAARLRHL